MRVLHWDDGTRWDDINAYHGEPGYVLEPGDPGYRIPPPEPGALSSSTPKNKTMSNNATPTNRVILLSLAHSMYDGQVANEVSVFRLNGLDRLLVRLEATTATLQDGQWLLENTRRMLPDHLPEQVGTQRLPTDLTVGRVQDSFASPDTLSVWALPDFIGLLERSGFSAIRHKLHFQALLALPLLAGTMALVSAGFSMRATRRGGVAQMIGSGVAAGFALFVVSKVAEEFGQSGALPAALAAWAPAGAGLLLSIALLLHLEDG